MTLEITYPEIQNAFVGNEVKITNKGSTSISLLKISTDTVLFTFQLSLNGTLFESVLYPMVLLKPNEVLSVYLKATTQEVDRIITKNIVNLEVEYV